MKIIPYADALVAFAFNEADVYYTQAPVDERSFWDICADKACFEKGGEGYIFAVEED